MILTDDVPVAPRVELSFWFQLPELNILHRQNSDYPRTCVFDFATRLLLFFFTLSTEKQTTYAPLQRPRILHSSRGARRFFSPQFHNSCRSSRERTSVFTNEINSRGSPLRPRASRFISLSARSGASRSSIGRAPRCRGSSPISLRKY